VSRFKSSDGALEISFEPNHQLVVTVGGVTAAADGEEFVRWLTALLIEEKEAETAGWRVFKEVRDSEYYWIAENDEERHEFNYRADALAFTGTLS